MPPMPWPAFRNATDEDLKAMYAYLRTLKPITNHVPDYQPAVESSGHSVTPGTTSLDMDMAWRYRHEA
jgi:hypothetical protein